MTIVICLIGLVVGLVIGVVLMALVISTNRDMNYFMGQRAIDIAYNARKVEPVEDSEPGFDLGWNSACEYIASKIQNNPPPKP